MRVTKKGKIVDDFYVMGHANVPVYLLDGPKPALFDAGFMALAKCYEQDIKKVLGSRSPAYLFLTHSHFDHVGAAGYLKKVWPDLQIAGSVKCSDTLTKQNAIRLIKELNEEGTRTMRSLNIHPIYEGPFEEFTIDLTLEPEQEMDMGLGRTLKVLSTPGHTWDFMSYWIPEEKILIGSEALGCDDGTGDIQTEFLIDYDVYMSSLAQLSQLDAQVLCPGHKLVLTGSDIGVHLDQSYKSAKNYLIMVEKFFKEEKGDTERVIKRVKKIEWDPKPWPKQPEQAYLLNTQQRVEKIRERMLRKKF